VQSWQMNLDWTLDLNLCLVTLINSTRF